MVCLRRIFIASILVLSQSTAFADPSELIAVPEKRSALPEVALTELEFADARLKESGLSAPFIASIRSAFIDNNPEWRESAKRIIELNVFGFLSRSDYSVHDSPNAKKNIVRYLSDHRVSFVEARKQYPVSSSAIASLMWVETKYGKVMGTFPVAWVYYSLVLGAHPGFIKDMLTLLPPKIAKDNPKNLSYIAAENKVIERCQQKSVWALDEMKAVSFIHETGIFNPLKVKASFAGAFGLGQFIPSSYLKFSESLHRKNADLFKPSDAILSIAHFLQENGWDEKDPESKAKALFSYNRSKDYGSIILKLAHDISHPKK